MPSRLTKHLKTGVAVGDVTTCMTKGKTTLIQKDPEKGNAVSNYCPITCLQLMWKLLTSLLAKIVYAHLYEKNVLTDEWKGCRNDSQGTKDQLLVYKQILKHCKKETTA